MTEQNESVCILIYLPRLLGRWRVIHWHFPRSDIVNCHGASEALEEWRS